MLENDNNNHTNHRGFPDVQLSNQDNRSWTPKTDNSLHTKTSKRVFLSDWHDSPWSNPMKSGFTTQHLEDLLNINPDVDCCPLILPSEFSSYSEGFNQKVNNSPWTTDGKNTDNYPTDKHPCSVPFPKDKSSTLDRFHKDNSANLVTFNEENSPTLDTFPEDNSPSLDTFPEDNSPTLDCFHKDNSAALVTFAEDNSPTLVSFPKKKSHTSQLFTKDNTPTLIPFSKDTSPTSVPRPNNVVLESSLRPVDTSVDTTGSFEVSTSTRHQASTLPQKDTEGDVNMVSRTFNKFTLSTSKQRDILRLLQERLRQGDNIFESPHHVRSETKILNTSRWKSRRYTTHHGDIADGLVLERVKLDPNWKRNSGIFRSSDQVLKHFRKQPNCLGDYKSVPSSVPSEFSHKTFLGTNVSSGLVGNRSSFVDESVSKGKNVGEVEGILTIERTVSEIDGIKTIGGTIGQLDGKESTERTIGQLNGTASTERTIGQLNGTASTERTIGQLNGTKSTERNLGQLGKTSTIIESTVGQLNERPLQGMKSSEIHQLDSAESSKRTVVQLSESSGRTFLLPQSQSPRTAHSHQVLNVEESPTDNVTPIETHAKSGTCSTEKDNSTKTSSYKLLEDFDVYNIETTMPTIDWVAMEAHLKNAAKEADWLAGRRNDREEIRRRLALDSDSEDYFFGQEKLIKKPSLTTRLKNGMNLQLCFMNEVPSDQERTSNTEESLPLIDDELVTGDTSPNNNTHQPLLPSGTADTKRQRPSFFFAKQKSWMLRTRQKHESSVAKVMPKEIESFYTTQAKLQAEARQALAQAKEMARMQMEVERQNSRKSPKADTIGFADHKKHSRNKNILWAMNIAQLQIIVNDLHSQIEGLNEDLVRLLLTRDDLHMEQDSMLVDIEDLSGYLSAKEKGHLLLPANEIPH